MRSFKVERATDFDTPEFAWRDNLSLTCRDCLEVSGEERSSFVPSHVCKVGEGLTCPFCGEISVVPKKARWA